MMLFATTRRSGRRLLGVSLTADALQQLRDGRPLLIDGAQLGFDTDLALLPANAARATIGYLRAAGIDMPMLEPPGEAA